MAFVCSICLELLSRNPLDEADKAGDDADVQIVAINCGHAYHLDCLQRWLKSTVIPEKKCPLCQSQVFECWRLYLVEGAEATDGEKLKKEVHLQKQKKKREKEKRIACQELNFKLMVDRDRAEKEIARLQTMNEVFQEQLLDANKTIDKLRAENLSKTEKEIINGEPVRNKKRDQNEDNSLEAKRKECDNDKSKRRKLDSGSFSSQPGCSFNIIKHPTHSGTKSFSGSNATSATIFRTITSQDEEMFRAKNQILAILKDKSSVSAKVICRAVRLGTYSSVCASNPSDGSNIIVGFTKAGILFNMAHYKEPATKVQLVIPISSILFFGATMNSKSLPFVVVRTEIHIAALVQEKLGIEPSDAVKFMPTSKNLREQYIVFFAWEFSGKAKTAIKNMPAFRMLIKMKANC